MATDLAVTLREDRPGAFSAVAEALGAAGVNIEGGAQIEGAVHILVETGGAGRQALESAGFGVEASEVVIAHPADRPGGLARITRALAEAGVSLRFLYLASNDRVVMGTDDLDKARRSLPT